MHRLGLVKGLGFTRWRITRVLTSIRVCCCLGLVWGFWSLGNYFMQSHVKSPHLQHLVCINCQHECISTWAFDLAATVSSSTDPLPTLSHPCLQCSLRLLTQFTKLNSPVPTRRITAFSQFACVVAKFATQRRQCFGTGLQVVEPQCTYVALALAQPLFTELGLCLYNPYRHQPVPYSLQYQICHRFVPSLINNCVGKLRGGTCIFIGNRPSRIERCPADTSTGNAVDVGWREPSSVMPHCIKQPTQCQPASKYNLAGMG